jgi:hypothetical protein
MTQHNPHDTTQHDPQHDPYDPYDPHDNTYIDTYDPNDIQDKSNSSTDT